MHVSLSELETIIIALIALFIGMAVRAAVPWLRRIDLPDAVVGGLLMALLALVLRLAAGWEFTFGSHLRVLLLLIFFSTIGLSAKLRLLAAGGRPLVILCIVTVLLIALQNLAGAAVAVAWGAHPFYGLLGGGLSFVGGPGTALAWAKEASAAGLELAHSVGIGAATLAVIAGALLAGPAAGYLIRKNGLHPAEPASAPGAGEVAEPDRGFGVSGILVALLMIAVSVYLGEKINVWARANGLLLPGFLSAMLSGVVLANGADALRIRFDLRPAAAGGEAALKIFLAMSLMSMPIAAMSAVILPLLVNIVVQLLVIGAVAYFLLFPLLGRDYDAAVTTAGFIGFGIASMPVAMATMDEVTKRHGPSPKAFLVVTLAGAVFVDLANATVAKLFLLLPGFGLG